MQKYSFVVLSAALVCTQAADTAFGQAAAAARWFTSGATWDAARAYGNGRYGYGYGYPALGGTNVISSAGQAASDVIRSRGEAAESYSRAAINAEEARSSYIDNSEKWLDAYWARKRKGQAEQEQDREARRAALQRYLEYKKTHVPVQLSSSQLDPATGKVTWPTALSGSQFAEERKKVDEVFRTRAYTDTNSADVAGAIVTNARKMQKELKKNIRKMPAPDYIAARSFLERLINEARVTPS